jgi:hypothetical protein
VIFSISLMLTDLAPCGMKISYQIPEPAQTIAALTPISDSIYPPLEQYKNFTEMMLPRAVKSFAKLVTVSASLPSRLGSAGHGVRRSISRSSVGAPPCGRPHGGNNARPHGAGFAAGSAIGVHPPSRSPLRWAKERRRFPPLPPLDMGSIAQIPQACPAYPPDGIPARKAHHREHRVHRENVLPAARAARIRPSSVSSVVNPSSAGHGVHRSISQSSIDAPPCGRPHGGTNGRPHGAGPTAGYAIVVHRSPAVSTPSSAGHGVHRSVWKSPLSLDGERPA